MWRWALLPVFRCVCGFGSERRGSHPALRHQRGSDQSDHHRSDGLAVPHGDVLHHRRLPVRRSHPREVLPRQVRHLGEPFFIFIYPSPFPRSTHFNSCFSLPRSSTPTSCSTSWWSPGRLSISTASPTCRSSGTQREGAAPTTATFNPVGWLVSRGGTGLSNTHRITLNLSAETAGAGPAVSATTSRGHY